MSGPRLIDDLADLERWLAGLGDVTWLGLASEANAMHAYRPSVCLVQLAVGRGDAREPELVAVDPLAFQGVRPHPLASLPERLPPSATVLVHGGEYTVAGLRRDHYMDLSTARVVDLQQAAVLLGLPETGYRSLCKALFGETTPAPISVDWHQRPLAAASVEHALQDVRFLGRLWHALGLLIAAADLHDELSLASTFVLRTAPVANLPDPSRFRRIDGAAGLGPAALGLLAALVGWRDAKAKELDLPPGKLFPNLQLVALARRPDRAADEIARMRFHTRLLYQDREALRRVVVLALADPGSRPAPSGPRPRNPGPPGPQVKARIERLKRWRREEAERRGVGLQAVLPGAALEHIAFAGVVTVTALAAIPSLGRRRIERYAAILLTLCADT